MHTHSPLLYRATSYSLRNQWKSVCSQLWQCLHLDNLDISAIWEVAAKAEQSKLAKRYQLLAAIRPDSVWIELDTADT